MWNSEQLSGILENLGASEYENIFVHSNLGFLGKIEESLSPVVEVLDTLETFSSNVNIILPAFTYSLTRGQTYDPLDPGGIDEMGLLSMLAFKRGYDRSNDPMFGLLAKGPAASEIIRCEFNKSFGPGSAFRKIMDARSLILLICAGGGSTLVHEIEFELNVGYRFQKEFTGKIKNRDQNIETINWTTYVRNLTEPRSEADFTLLTGHLIKTRSLLPIRLGSGYIGAMSTATLRNNVIALLEDNPSGLVKG
jgi:aminoglycoside N3'-acetyltransferase